MKTVVEFEHIRTGYRFWSDPVWSYQIDKLIDDMAEIGYAVSDIDTSAE